MRVLHTLVRGAVVGILTLPICLGIRASVAQAWREEARRVGMAAPSGRAAEAHHARGSGRGG